MWPWEHLAVGYLLYSLGARALGRDPPSDGGVVALAVATQLPDLLDKPLSWGLGWFPSGYAVGHSAFVALPLGVAAVVVARRAARPDLGAAFAVGHWSHLAADVLSPLRGGDGPSVSRVLWPIAEVRPYGTDYGLRRGAVYVERFVAELSAMDLTAVVLLYLLVPLGTLALWALDGAPGARPVVRAVDGMYHGR